MKHVGQWLFNGVATLSLLGCLGLAGLWVRTIHIRDQIACVPGSGNGYTLGTGPHVVTLDVTTNASSLVNSLGGFMLGVPRHGLSFLSWRWGKEYIFDPAYEFTSNGRYGEAKVRIGGMTLNWSPPAHHWFGFGYESMQQSFGTPFVAQPLAIGRIRVTVPIWVMMVLLAILPGRWIWVYVRQWRRLRNNCCMVCGFDLRDTDTMPGMWDGENSGAVEQ